MVKKKKLCWMVVVLLSFCMFGNFIAFAESEIPNATSQFYVNDFAGIIDDALEAEMQKRAVDFAKSTDGIQVVVTTVKTIGNADPVLYTVDMYNKYGIGKNNMGVLIMLSVETRDIQIRLGTNMTKYFSDSKAGKICDKYGIPYFKNDDFAKGLYEMQKATIEQINSKVQTANNEGAVVSTNTKHVVSKGTIGTIFGIIAIIALGVAAYFVLNNYINKKKIRKEEQKEQEERMKTKIQTLEEQLRNSNSESSALINRKDNKIYSLERSLKDTQNELKNLQERYKRAKIAYPDLEEKIEVIFAQEKIEADKKKAFEVEKCLTKTLELECTRHNLQRFQSACDAFEGLTNEQMSYIPEGIISKLKTYYSKSFEEQRKFEVEEQIRKNKAKAAEVQALILTALACSVSRHSLSKLTDACRAYDRLNSEQRKYVQADVNTLYSMKRKAERLQEEYEEEERRRRQREEEERRRRQREDEERRRRQSYSSSSSSSFGGFHSGFGGSSTGHGAGRKF